ncbi:uncharacterized protein TNIN_496311 [Trichonephila inaurata madagascariensis]|uniref:Peptidase A2 domain-containing protein n=1 Tax=Trichonephila inaurata madagascariensis TaxID=2747483 RepID=A0A8X7BVD5_9ARAC|nr:uncharacterized protein TNIN_496311 [Trichonephila inaurata madagascariensis]
MISLNVRTPLDGVSISIKVKKTVTRQPVTATTGCHIGSSRLLVTDQLSKKQFLVDTGSDLCVFPSSSVSSETRSKFQLKAANNSTIKTYGFLTLPLDLGLRRHFSWRFVIADVPLPVIGSDFLAHFGLLPDCKHKLLLDRITSLSVRGQSTRHSMLSIKIISGESTPYDHILRVSNPHTPCGHSSQRFSFHC